MISYIMGMTSRGVLLIPANRIFAVIILFLTIFIRPATSFAQEDTSLTLDGTAGFDNSYKEGEWLPVRIILENNGRDLKGNVVVKFQDSGNALSPVMTFVELPSVSRKEITLYIYPANTFAAQLTVTFISDRSTLIEKSFTVKRLNKTDDLYGIIAKSPSAYNILSALDPPNGSSNVVELSIDDLPDQVQGYGAINTMVFSGIDSGELDQRQLEAVAEWTSQGGRLIITGGADWERTAAGFAATDLLPLAVIRASTLNSNSSQSAFNQIISFSGIEDLTQSSENFILSNGNLKPDAEVLLRLPQDPQVSLVIKRGYGAGEVLYFTFDPSQPPLRSWAGIEYFYKNLFQSDLTKPAWGNGFLDWNMAQQAAQTLPSLGLPSILLICGFLLLYIIILGPANFILLRYIKRRELGWITIPGFVVVFSVFVFLGGSMSRGQKPILNRLAIVQGWSGSSYARVDGVLGVYSPNRTAYDVVSKYPTLLHAIPNTTIFQPDSITIEQTANSNIVPDINVDIGGVFPLAYQGSTEPPQIDQDLIMGIDDQGMSLEGKIINQSDLTLENVVLLTPSNVVDLGTISPGETVQINEIIGMVNTANAEIGPGGLKTLPGAGVPLPYSSPQNNSIEQILGTYDYYANRETYRKYALLVAAMSYSPTSFNQKNEVYLIGWSTKPVVDIQLSNQSSNTDDITLFILGKNPPVEFRGERWTLSPGFFQWSPLDSFRTDISPYNQFLYAQTSYGLAFTPRQTIEFSEIESLTFHIKSPYQTGRITDVEFNLWNFESQEWETFDDLEWGDNEIQSPERFVATKFGSDTIGDHYPGTIRLQVNSNADYLQIESSDFTLIIKR